MFDENIDPESFRKLMLGSSRPSWFATAAQSSEWLGGVEESVASSIRAALEFSADWCKEPGYIRCDSPTDRAELAVVITNHNSGTLLPLSVLSLINQTEEKIHIVVVDDRSSDISLPIARFLEKRIEQLQLVELPWSLGTYAAKNIALKSIKARYVTFQDADEISISCGQNRQRDALRSAGASCVAAISKGMGLSASDGRLVADDGACSGEGLISLMLDWHTIQRDVGFFDAVRIDADDEYKGRIISIFGKSGVVELEEAGYAALIRESWITNSSRARNGWLKDNGDDTPASVRRVYAEAFQKWHENTAPSDLRLEFPEFERPFDAPRSIDPFYHSYLGRITMVAFSADADEKMQRKTAELLVAAGIDNLIVVVFLPSQVQLECYSRSQLQDLCQSQMQTGPNVKVASEWATGVLGESDTKSFLFLEAIELIAEIDLPELRDARLRAMLSPTYEYCRVLMDGNAAFIVPGRIDIRRLATGRTAGVFIGRMLAYFIEHDLTVDIY